MTWNLQFFNELSINFWNIIYSTTIYQSFWKVSNCLIPSTIQDMAISISLDILNTEYLMLLLFGDITICTVFGPNSNSFATLFWIFTVDVALSAITLDLGNNDLNSPIWANHFLNACFFKPYWSSHLQINFLCYLVYFFTGWDNVT